METPQVSDWKYIGKIFSSPALYIQANVFMWQQINICGQRQYKVHGMEINIWEEILGLNYILYIYLHKRTNVNVEPISTCPHWLTSIGPSQHVTRKKKQWWVASFVA